jgi:hypothetical protein
MTTCKIWSKGVIVDGFGAGGGAGAGAGADAEDAAGAEAGVVLGPLRVVTILSKPIVFFCYYY